MSQLACDLHSKLLLMNFVRPKITFFVNKSLDTAMSFSLSALIDNSHIL